MFAKFIPSALLFFAFTHGAMAIICGDPPLPACPTFAPCPPCATNTFCCLTRGSQCIPTGQACPRIGAASN
ncbi:hypothetical protein DFH08DRAFT_893171 [Mycena albidolilacea]|uniref:Granulins domain-containing protein n=1 Tax=Mycena albidolilacea TaxID=1033008 RepID=A0AAD6ZCH0_9AGAR|nr:hypothetical protein DFH08DRAFT_893171 [Mycena albidolilacea]